MGAVDEVDEAPTYRRLPEEPEFVKAVRITGQELQEIEKDVKSRGFTVCEGGYWLARVGPRSLMVYSDEEFKAKFVQV